MPDPTIIRGRPLPAEEQAIRKAFDRMARDEAAGVTRSGAEPAWLIVARAASARTRILDVSHVDAWRLSLRFDAGPLSSRRTGSGGAR